MAIQAHLMELNEKHKHLDTMISTEMQHPSSDTLKLSSLKKEKLRIKEEIERLRSQADH